MAKNNFTHENTLEDGECPFCGAFVPKGVSVCEKCHAMHGTKTDPFFGILIFPALAAAFLGGGGVGAYLKSSFLGWTIGLAILFTCFVGISKLATLNKGWFR